MLLHIFLLFLILALAFVVGYFSGRIDGAVKVYFMSKEEARRWIWGR
jgi:hypothetical protein